MMTSEVTVKITFPAMRAKMGGRQYYLTTMALSEIPRFFKFNDWESVTPELRAQRVMNESRVPAISKYIIDHEDDYLFSSITCSYSADLVFTPSSPETPDNGQISLDLEQMEFVINDGQHRCAAIAAALKECPSIAQDRISVLLFPMESLERMQQMFSDLNRYAQRTSKSLNILYDQRDPLAALTMEAVELIDAFRGMVDFERISIPIRSAKLFALTAIYDANHELLGKTDFPATGEEFDRLRAQVVEYWTAVARVIPDWTRVAKGQLQAPAVRQEKISTHSIVMRALGGVGRLLLQKYPDDWTSTGARASVAK
jgi:DNA sulfur modification protein DndB